MEFLQEIGAIAGIAAFLGLAVLALLYFAQARDVRRLRENASFLIEEGEPARAGSSEPAREGERAAGEPPAAGSDAEAFRRAELARQAAERRERFERRRRSGGRFGGNGWPRPSALVVILAGALVLAVGVGFAATNLLGGDDEGPGGAQEQRAAAREIEIRVLNSTAEPGLAGQFARQLQNQGFIARSDNTEIPFEESSVMFQGQNQAAARQVARAINIENVEPLVEDIRQAAGGARVVVVIGEDKAQGA